MRAFFFSSWPGAQDLSQHIFYLARAAEARADAAAATLANVRERCLRSEAAWTAMADRAERTDKAREKQLRDKAAAALLSEDAAQA